jgi:hypothetical protein
MDRRAETDSGEVEVGNRCLEASIKPNYLTLIDRVLFVGINLLGKKFSSVFHASIHKSSDKALCLVKSSV